MIGAFRVIRIGDSEFAIGQAASTAVRAVGRGSSRLRLDSDDLDCELVSSGL